MKTLPGHYINDIVSRALQNLNIPQVDFTVEHPGELSHGDYACNVAMVCAKQLAKNPKEVAEMVVGEMEKIQTHPLPPLVEGATPIISRIEIAGPGFINITLSSEYLASTISTILSEGEKFGNIDIHRGQKIIIEHSSPNLFKPFHIGHLMNNTIGESLVRIMRATGGDVITMTFPSDISIGIGKAIWYLLREHGDNYTPTDIAVLGDAYVQGTRIFDEDESIHSEVKRITDNLYAGISSPELDLYHACRVINIEYFEKTIAKLGSHMDHYVYESEAGVAGKKLVTENTPQVFTQSEGAIVYIPEESKKHISTAVFINSQNNPTYEAKDLGLLQMKFERYTPDVSLFVTDYQQGPHFDVVLDAAEHIDNSWKQKSHHIMHGRMSFKGQKMSSRLGGVPLVTDMIDTVADEVREKSERQTDAKIIDDIALGAIKFAILRAKPGSNINFDPETSLSFEGDSGPYLQYTHARIESLLNKGRELGIDLNSSNSGDVSAQVTNIHRILYRFPEIVANAAENYGPHHIVTYLLQVAQEFNSYYGANKMVDTADLMTTSYRLRLARAVQVVLHNGLYLLGITAPDEM
jgi:arginyl-tRNA synthetase